MKRVVHGVLVCLTVLLSGCIDDPPVQLVPDWELVVDGQRERVRLPAHFGHQLSRFRATYALETVVTLDPTWKGRTLTLALPLLRAPVSLEIDGRVIDTLDEHLLDRVHVTAPHRWRIDPRDVHDGRLALRIVVDSIWSQSSWIDTVPRLSPSASGDRWTRSVRIFTLGTQWASLIALLTIAVVFFFLHLVGGAGYRSRGEADKNAEVAHFAVGAAIFAAVQLGLLLPIFGSRDVALVVVAMLVSARASIQLARGYLGLPPLRRHSAWAIAGVTALLLAIGGGFIRSGTEIILLIGLLLGVSYLWYSVVRARRAKSHAVVELTWLAVGWLFISSTGAIDIVSSMGWGAPLGGLQLTCTSLLVVVLTQAFILGRDHERLLRSQSTLNRELEQRIVEEERLNQELRRKVGDRSRELSTALRKLQTDGQGLLVSGTVLGDLYRVSERLGAGAMGEVYRVERLTDGNSLAAKVIRGRVRPEALQRFTREAELAASIDHPNVVRVYDVDVTSTGELFLVMELVEGASLEERREAFGDEVFARTVMRHVASALEAVHARGVVHRDLKPANVLVAAGPLAKVADFGIAGFIVDPYATGPGRVGEHEESGEAMAATMDAPAVVSPRLTVTGAIMGTPLYMAPELLHGDSSIGPPADLFAFGLIAYQLVGGGTLEQKGDRNVFRRVELRPFLAVAPWLGEALAALLERCVAPEPAQRPTASDVVEALS